MTNRLAKAFPYLLVAPAVLPLVYVSGLVFPYVATKTFLLWSFGIIALAVFSFLALSGKPFFYRRLRSPFSWVPFTLLAVAYVASIFGVDFYRSFWGLFDRGDGLLTSTVITTFFYLILISADRTFLERLVKAIAVVAGIVAMIAVLQWIETVFGAKVSFLPPVSGRIGSTFGNAAFLAGYLGMALFVILYALRNASGVWRRVFQASAVLSVLAVIFAATRGTILALALSFLVALAYVAWKGDRKIRRYGRYGLVAVIFLAILFFGFRSQLARIPFEPINRIASISLSDGTVASRLFVWQHIGEEALKQPWLGYGAEHVAQVFDKVYDPSKIVEQWFDRSHNAFLDYFAQYGVFGLALYLALVGVFVTTALRLYRRESPDLLNSGFLFFLLILTYAVQNFFVFDTPHSLWLLYALFALLVISLDDSSATALSPNRIPPVVSILASIIILLAIIPTVAMPLYANILLTKGYKLHLVDVNRANAYFERGLALKTFADLEYGYQARNIYIEHQVGALTGQNRIAAYEYALSVLTANFKRYPYDAHTATYLGQVMDAAPPGVAVDDVFNRETLEQAIVLSPLRAQAWYMVANISLRKANTFPAGSKERVQYYREAISVLETYAEKEPTLPVPRYILTTLYYSLGDTATAKRWADEALPLYATPDAAAASPAVKYYIAIGDWQNAVRFLSDLVASSPLDYDILYDLAKVTYLAGDPAASLRIVEKLKKENPTILETDQNFLNAITAYEQSRK